MNMGRPEGTAVSGGTAIAIIGAGPYGLSIAAHLRQLGADCRIFGRPMESWRERMPAGMCLKSDGFASNLYEPSGRFTLERFCADRGIPYDARMRPVPLETFIAYGLAFQAQYVNHLEETLVTALTRAEGGFRLQLADGSALGARRVVVATGISDLDYLPRELAPLGPLCTHSSAHHDLSGFSGRRVLVIGGGASAADVAALLSVAGASVELVARRPLEFHTGPSPGGRPWWERVRRPHFGLGPSLRSTLYTLFPGAFRRAPEGLRSRIVRRHLGPAPGWFVKDLIRQQGIPLHEGYALASVARERDEAVLRFTGPDGSILERRADHVIAATGYRPALHNLPFMDPSLREGVRVTRDGYPVLSANFEASVPGLYFVGLLSAGSFGPLVRFALGARYTARRVSPHLAAFASHLRQARSPTTVSREWPSA